jgi:outer membrane protein assembly factor BamA
LRTFSYILAFIFSLACGITSAQKGYSLLIKAHDHQEVIDNIQYKHNFPDKASRRQELQNYLFTLYDNAYLTAAYDSLREDSLNLAAYISTGEIYKWARLGKGNVDEGILSETGFREKLYRDKPLHFRDVKRVQEKILLWCENNGYPFASIKLDSVQVNGNTIAAQLKLTKNNLVRIDSISIRGNAKIAPIYIYRYLGIKPGDLYRESAVRNIGTRIRELPFLRESKPAVVVFTPGSAKVILFLDKKRSSQVDGIAGLLPDNKTGKLLFTGDLHLKLQNSLSHGELIDITARKLQVQTQDVRTHLTYPFLFSTPFGVDHIFKLYKKDTTWVDVQQNIGLQYLLIGGDYFKVFVNTRKSDLLSTKAFQNATALPPYADVSTVLYGIGYRTERLDYRFNPRKGFTIAASASTGNKKIRRNARLNPVVYEQLPLVSAQYNGELEAAVYLPVRERAAIKAGLQGAGIYSSAELFRNELFRIGGLHTLRGVDEESINASAYSVLTLEYRYLLEQNSYLYLFTDGAWYENRSRDGYIKDTPFGFGAGISFETKAGIFSINYALGRQFNNPIQLRSGKVHFGILSYF